MEDSIREMTRLAVQFRDERNWSQFHNPKDLAISVSLESAEILEHFQWKSESEIDSFDETWKVSVGHELADVLIYLVLLADRLKIDLVDCFEKKMSINASRYPVHKSYGTSAKYDKLR